MKIQIPTGLTALLASYQQVLIACHLHEQQSLLSSSFMARLEPTYDHLARLADRHAEQKHLWSLALQMRRRHLTALTRLVRDSWIMLKRRDQREHQPGLLLGHFRMPSLAPQHASALEWLEHGRNLLAGEQRATQAGHAPMAFPSADELATCLEAATRAEVEYTAQFQALRFLETELREVQRHASHTLRCLAARLRESQFDERPEQARALLRSFGFRFKASASDNAEAHAELARAEETSVQAAREAQVPTADHEPTTEAPDQATSWTERLRSWGHGLKRSPRPTPSPAAQTGPPPGRPAVRAVC